MNDTCTLYRQEPKGEVHNYKVYQYKVGWNGDIYCDHYDANKPSVLEQILEERGDEQLLQADGLEDACIGIDAREGKLVYSVTKVLDILQERDGMSYDDALEFFEYNIACAYVGDKTPIFVHDNYEK